MVILVEIACYAVWLTVLQAVVIRATKRIYPEKRGNVFDTKFQRDWYQSCDEAEQYRIGQYSYTTFRVMNIVFLAVMLGISLLSLCGSISPVYIFLVGLLWLIHQLCHTCSAYRTEHSGRQ